MKKCEQTASILGHEHGLILLLLYDEDSISHTYKQYNMMSRIYRNVSSAETSVRREISDLESTNMTTKQSQVSLLQQRGPINDSMTQQMSIKRKRREYRRQGPVNDSMTSSLQTLRGNRREYRRQMPVKDSMTNDFVCLVRNEFCSERRDEKSRWKVIASTPQRVVIKPEYNPSTFDIEPSLRRYNSEVPISAALRFRFELTLVYTDGFYIQVKDMIEGRPSGLPLGEGRRRAIIDSTQRKISRRCKNIVKVLNGNSKKINDVPCEEDLQKMYHHQFGAKLRGESFMINRPSILRESEESDNGNAFAAVLLAIVCLFGSVVALKVCEVGTSLYQLI